MGVFCFPLRMLGKTFLVHFEDYLFFKTALSFCFVVLGFFTAIFFFAIKDHFFVHCFVAAVL